MIESDDLHRCSSEHDQNGKECDPLHKCCRFQRIMKTLNIRIEISPSDQFFFVDLNFPNNQTNLNN